MTKILVVDDDNLSLKNIAAYLRLKDFVVQEAHDGIQAIDHLEHDRFDLVLSDVLMPSLDGLELLEYVRSALPRTPIMLMSGFAAVEVEEIRSRRAADFIVKPIRFDELEKKIRVLVSSKTGL